MKELKVTSILKEYDATFSELEKFTACVHDLLQRLLEENRIRVHSITFRVKDRDSLKRKIGRPDKSYTCLADITDISGVRVITYLPEVVDEISRIIKTEFAVDKINSIDKRQVLDPDRFGYLSVHYVVSLSPQRLKLSEYKRYASLKCEVQIRSILQHAWAEIQHDLGYKTSLEIPNEIKRRFFKLAGLLEVADDEFSRIRHDLAEYETNVREEIETQPGMVPINKTSLEAFVQSSELNQEIAEKLEKMTGCELFPTDLGVSSKMIEQLSFCGIHTIAELRQSLKDNEKLVVKMASKVLGPPTKNREEGAGITPSVGIFYLCYVLLLKQNNIEVVRQYTREYIGTKDWVKWANDLMTLFKQLQTT
jgi:putative GTP pyrophosphokinase